MNVWFLSVFMWINGAWVAGENIESGGWSPRQYESEKICELRRDFSMKSVENSRAAGRKVIPTHWVCNKGEPIVMVPADLGVPEPQ